MVRLISSVVAVVLAVNSVLIPLAQAASFSPQFFGDPQRSAASRNSSSLNQSRPTHGRLSIPRIYGEIVETHPGRENKFVYHVQDVHDLPSAQANIAGIISSLADWAENQDKKLLVAVEGAAGPVHFEEIAHFPDREAKENVAGGLLNAGYLFGEEYAAILRPAGSIKIIGIESPRLYKRNVSVRERSSSARTRILSALRETRRQLDSLKEHHFNPTLTQLEEYRTRMEEGRLPFDEYLRCLNRTAPATLRHYPLLKTLAMLLEEGANTSPALIEAEKEKLLQELMSRRSEDRLADLLRQARETNEGGQSPLSFYGALLNEARGSYPALAWAHRYHAALDAMDATELLLQTEAAEREIAQHEIRHPLAGRLYELSRWVETQEKFFSLSLMPHEWQALKNNDVQNVFRRQEEIRDYVRHLKRDIGARAGVPSFLVVDLKTAHAGASEFYRAAEARDASLVENLSRLLEQHVTDTHIVAMIAGGFHTDGMTRRFRSSGIGYAVVRPELETESRINGENYSTFSSSLSSLKRDLIQSQFLRNPGGLANAGGTQFVMRLLRGPREIQRALRQALAASPARPKAAPVPSFATVSGRSVTLYDATAIVGIVCFAAGYLFAKALQWVRAHLPDVEAMRSALENVPAAKAPDGLTPQDWERLRVIQRVFSLTDPDVLYLAAYLEKLRHPNPNDEPLKIITDRTDPNPTGNFIFDAQMSPEERSSYEIPYEQMNTAENRLAAGRSVVIMTPLNAGLAENFGRNVYVQAKVQDATGLLLPVPIGSKGGDLLIKGEENNFAYGDVNLDTFKTLQIVALAASGRFAKIQLNVIVNNQSKSYYEAMLDSPYPARPGLAQDEPFIGMSMREALALRGVEILPMHIQNALPGVLAGVNELPVVEKPADALTQPGGHGQLGVAFLMEAVREIKNRPHNPKHPRIRFFFNQDNVNARPDPNIVGHMARNNHPVYMLTTPATLLDVKGGKLGRRFLRLIAKVIPLPSIMELAQAQRSGQENAFKQAGQPGGIGVSGTQSFNTNLQYINEGIVGEILGELAELLESRGEHEINGMPLARVMSPDLIPKNPKNHNGQNYMPVDGAISSVMLNVNAYFEASSDPRVKEILSKRGLQHFLYFVPVDRMDHFVPIKYPQDWRLYVGTDRFSFNADKLILVDHFDGTPLPEIKLASKVDGKERGFWAEYHTIAQAWGRLAIEGLTSLSIRGQVLMRDARLNGIVQIVSEAPYQTHGVGIPDLNSERYKSVLPRTAPDDQHKDGRLLLENVRVVIDKYGNITLTEPIVEPDQDISPNVLRALGSALALTSVLTAAYQGLGWVHATMALLAFLMIAVADAADRFSGAALVEGPIDFSEAVGDDRYDPRLLDEITRFSQVVENYTGRNVERISLARDVWARTNGSDLTIGAGTLARSGPIGYALRRLLLHFALRHELVHFSRWQMSSETMFGRIINEAIAYPAGLLLTFVPLSPKSEVAVPSVGATSFLNASLMQLAGVAAKESRRMMENLRRALDRNERRTDAAAPVYISVDIAGFLEELEGDDTRPIAEAIDAVARLHQKLTDDLPVNAVVVFYNTSARFRALEPSLEAAVAKNRFGAHAFFFGADRVLPLDARDAGHVFRLAGIAEKLSPEDVVVFTNRDIAITEGRVETVHNLPHLSLALFAYTHYVDGRTVLDRLLESMQRLFKVDLTSGVSHQIQISILAQVAA